MNKTISVFLFSFLLSPFLSAAVDPISKKDKRNSAEVEHRWLSAAKEMVGTGFGEDSSRVWFNIGQGILNEVAYPRIDHVQVSDSQLLFICKDEFVEERRDVSTAVTHPPRMPRAVISGSHSCGLKYQKDVVVDPKYAVLRVRYQFQSLPADTRIFLLHKTAAGNDGASDVGRIEKVSGRDVFFATDYADGRSHVQTVAVSQPLLAANVGVVGVDDGWQELKKYGEIKSKKRERGPANLAFSAEITPSPEFEVVIGFGEDPAAAVDVLALSTARVFSDVASEFDAGWSEYQNRLFQNSFLSNSKESAFLTSKIIDDLLWNATVIKVHEDKMNRGAIIASFSIPNLPTDETNDGPGARDSKFTGGYHLVWVRDLYKSAEALLKLGDVGTALDALKFMARMERSDGLMAQNTWVDGSVYWTGHQLDQEAYPVLLAALLHGAGVSFDDSLKDFIGRRLAVLKKSSGFTEQERWEEVSGFSPNTLAVVAAALSRVGKAEEAARFMQLALTNTVARETKISRDPYFVRIAPREGGDFAVPITISNGGPTVMAWQLLDGGFLDWARYFHSLSDSFGILAGDFDKIIEHSVALIDDSKNGVRGGGRAPLYRRYNLDHYGYQGKGGFWPILTLERGRFDVLKNRASARDVYDVAARFLTPSGLCPEQLISSSGGGFMPMPHAAAPLVWCHAELITFAADFFHEKE